MRLLHYLFFSFLALVISISAYAQADYSGRIIQSPSQILEGKYDLEGANFSGAEIISHSDDDGLFSGANLKGANFSDTKIRMQYKHEGFQGANLQQANFSNAQVNSTNFDGANLQESNFSNAHVKYTRFDGANLQGVNFSNASLHKVSFDGSLQGANFANVRVYSNKPTDAVYFQGNLQKVNFSNASLVNTSFFKSNLQGANFQGAVFYISVRDDGDNNQAAIRAARAYNRLYDARLDLADIAEADFSTAEIFDAQLLKTCWSRRDKNGNALQPPNLPKDSRIIPDRIRPCPSKK